MLMRVDFPAPFGPSRPVTPGLMVIVMSLTATTLPNQRETWSMERVLMGAAHSLEGWWRATGGRSQPGLSVAADQQAVAARDESQDDEEEDDSLRGRGTMPSGVGRGCAEE